MVGRHLELVIGLCHRRCRQQQQIHQPIWVTKNFLIEQVGRKRRLLEKLGVVR